MVYTRWKCDRVPVFGLKLFTQIYPIPTLFMLYAIIYLHKHFSYCSEETERRKGWWVGYPYWRDPIARRNEAKYKQLILNNNVDVADSKWTGCSKAQLEKLQLII